ncbi:hypothetical protein [Embleya sp. NPDC050493]
MIRQDDHRPDDRTRPTPAGYLLLGEIIRGDPDDAVEALLDKAVCG